METVFFRLLQADDKATGLADAIAALRDDRPPNPVVHVVDTASFRQVPGSPFAYWVSDRIRRLFTELPPFEDERVGRTARCGLGTTDNFRFLRCWLEVPPSTLRARWMPYYDGGVQSPVFDEFLLIVDWERNGEEVKQHIESNFGSASRNVRGEDHYFLPGLVFPRRTIAFSPKVMPSGGIYSNAGQAGFMPSSELKAGIALLASRVCTFLISLSQGRTGDAAQFEVGLLKRLPWFGHLEDSSRQLLEGLTDAILTLKRSLHSRTETSHVFHLPALLQVPGRKLAERIAAWQTRVAKAERQLAECQREIDDIAFRLYGIEGQDRRAIEESVGRGQTAEGSDQEGEGEAEDETPDPDQRSLVAALLSYAVGCVRGRWDVRYATGERQPPELPDPFAPLPVSSPGMLQGPDGLPLRETPAGYPLRIDWDGILVDDPEHPDDIIRRVREVMELVWKDRAEAIEQEACEILSVKELRDYFRKPSAGGFWDDHVKRYSKSRRKAPIYWLLQSSKKNYALWLYYHRLDKDLFFKALLNYVEPKVQRETNRLDEMRRQKQAAGGSGKAAKKLDKDIERQEDLISELRDFDDKLRRAANLYLEPDLNDGVVLNIAPLHELVPWKEAKNYWQELLDGKYEWSSIGKQLHEKGLVK